MGFEVGGLTELLVGEVEAFAIQEIFEVLVVPLSGTSKHKEIPHIFTGKMAQIN